MVLQDIFDQLSYGELSQLAIGGHTLFDGSTNPEPQIAECDRPQLIAHINTALTALYTRFRLREKVVYLQLIPNKASYVLDPKFLIDNTESDEPTKYLVARENDPFDGTLVKVEQVSASRTELGLCEHPRMLYEPLILNQPNNPYSLRTPSMKTLLVPDSLGYDKMPQNLKIDYRANHPLINAIDGTYSAANIEIELPITHLQALLFHVASRIHNPAGMIEEFHSGNSYYAKYEHECNRLELENVQIDDLGENSNFHRQGFY